MKKRLLSTLLIVIITVMCCLMSVTVHAKTRDDAINWVRGLERQKVGSGQCVALISKYYSFLGASPVSGNACDYATNSLPSGWTREKGGVPQKGDILVYTGGYGHVAIAETTRYGWHQNWGGQYVQWVDRNYSSSFYSSYEGVTKYYWGCIRPNFGSSSQPTTKTEIKTNKSTYTVGENVTFTFSYKYGTSVSLGIDKDGSRYATPEVTGKSSYTRSFSEPGNYSVYVSGWSQSGYEDSAKVGVV